MISNTEAETIPLDHIRRCNQRCEKRIIIDTCHINVLQTGIHVPRLKQNRSTEGCLKLKRSVDMTSSGKNGLNIRTNASPKWDRTRCPEE